MDLPWIHCRGESQLPRPQLYLSLHFFLQITIEKLIQTLYNTLKYEILISENTVYVLLKLRDHRQIIFVTLLDGFSLLSKPSPPVLNRQY